MIRLICSYRQETGVSILVLNVFYHCATMCLFIILASNFYLFIKKGEDLYGWINEFITWRGVV